MFYLNIIITIFSEYLQFVVLVYTATGFMKIYVYFYSHIKHLKKEKVNGGLTYLISLLLMYHHNLDSIIRFLPLVGDL